MHRTYVCKTQAHSQFNGFELGLELGSVCFNGAFCLIESVQLNNNTSTPHENLRSNQLHPCGTLFLSSL